MMSCVPRAAVRCGAKGYSASARLAFAALVVGGLAACDLGSGGPGSMTARITGEPSLGAVVIDVTWRGVEGFQGLGNTRAYWAPVAGSPDRYRVVLVDPLGGELGMAIDVQDIMRAEVPAVAFVSAADVNNQMLSVARLKMRLGR
jgi:hypothetical protein